jgi:hypothetical protein
MTRIPFLSINTWGDPGNRQFKVYLFGEAIGAKL